MESPKMSELMAQLFEPMAELAKEAIREIRDLPDHELATKELVDKAKDSINSEIKLTNKDIADIMEITINRACVAGKAEIEKMNEIKENK